MLLQCIFVRHFVRLFFLTVNSAFSPITQIYWLIKADRLHPRNYLHTPTNYRHTDNYLRLVMVVVAPCCPRLFLAPNIDGCAPEIWPWPWPRPLTLTLKQCNSDAKAQFYTFDLDLWPTTLTYNPNLAKVKGVDLHTKYQGRMSNRSSRRTQTLSDKQTDKRMDTTKCIISLLR